MQVAEPLLSFNLSFVLFGIVRLEFQQLFPANFWAPIGSCTGGRAS